MALDKLKKNRKIVKAQLKSPKQLAKEQWSETKRQLKTGLNEMVNSVPAVMCSLKEELVSMVKAQIDAIINSVEIDLQEIAYLCNKGYRLYIEFKKATSKEEREKRKKELIIWMSSLPDKVYNGFILLIVKEALEEAVKVFDELWNAGLEMWQMCVDNFQSLKDLFEKIENFDPKIKLPLKNPSVEQVLALINKILPLVLSLTVLIQNYIINHGWAKDKSNNQVKALQDINAQNKGLDPKEIDKQKENTPLDAATENVYKDVIDASNFKINIGDCKLYPKQYVDYYDSSLTNCFVEPSQLLRVIKEDQARMKAKPFIDANGYSDSKYSENAKGQEDSICYLIPPSKKNLNDILNDNDNTDSKGDDCLHAIIEFDDECCKYPEEPYTWECLPGDLVYQDKTLATCLQYDHMVPVKSIFKSGVIRKDPCTEDFARIRKDVCNRHIIIDCYESGTQGLVDSSIVEELNNDFKKENCIYRLLYEYMNYSVLPNIIARKSYYSLPSKFKGLFINPSWTDNENHPSAEKIYNDFIEHFEETIDNFQYGIKALDSEDRIKGTNGDWDKLKGLSNEILNLRENFLFGKHNWSKAENGIIDLYNLRDSQHKSKCFGDYKDCRGLAWTYYTDLISKLQFHEDETCIHDYYKVLENIILRREQIEGYDWYSLKAKVISDLKTITNLTWDDLEKAYEGFDKFSSIQTVVSSNLKIESNDNYKKIYSVVNLFMLLKRRAEKYQNSYDYFKGDYLPMYSNVQILDLVRKEKQELEDFFKEKISLYGTVTMSSLLKRIKNLGEIQAEWPPYVEIVADGVTYKLFKFSNIDAYLKSLKKGTDNSLDASGINPNNYQYKEPDSKEIKAQVEQALKNIDGQSTMNSKDLIPDTTDDKFSGLTDIPFTDIRYWMKYCGIATLVSIPFLATGLVILGVPIPLPGIYIPMTVVKGDVLMVIGLGIRGITFFPMIIYVNTGQDNSTALVPILMALKAVRDQFEQQISKVENTIPNIAELLMSQLENNNANLLNQNKQIETQIANLKSIQKPEWAEIKKQMKNMLKEDTRQVVTRLKGR